MAPHPLIGFVPIVLVTSMLAHAGPTDLPTFEQRVEAQRAIERVYFSHLVDKTRLFDEAVPPALLQEKVRNYLQQSAALKAIWNTEITPDALRRELERIAGGTRMPDRLSEIYAALGNDPVLIEECVARPALVNRLSRSFFAADDLIHNKARAEAEALRARLAGGDMDPAAPDPRRSEVVVVESAAGQELSKTGSHIDPGKRELDHEAFARWRTGMPDRVGEPGAVIEQVDHLTIAVLLSDEPASARVAIYSVPKLGWDTWWAKERHRWRPEDYRPVDRLESSAPPPAPMTSSAAASPCQLSQVWDNGVLDDLPTGRDSHSAVWTGSLMLVWGGFNDILGVLNTGSRYDPVIDTWHPISTLDAPIARYLHTAIWTGGVMVVWGGYGKPPRGQPLRSGGRYDPETDTWQTVTTKNAPSARYLHTAVWTGDTMIVWGGVNAKTQLGSGARYDPVRNRWSVVSTNRAPTPRVAHTAVWTGTRMIVWGGYAGGYLYSTGAAYDPSTNSWTTLTAPGAPAVRALHTAVWTGTEMIIWGGIDYYTAIATGGRYNPVTKTWTTTKTQGAPTGRADHLAVWTGSEMLIYGGDTGQGSALRTGGRYQPATNSWSSTSTVGAPSSRDYPTGIWTGSRLIVWGGSASLNTGGRYDPGTDSWTPTSVNNTPAASKEHSAFWTGTLMLVWGGYDALEPVNSGGRYDPLIDAWSHMAVSGAPEPRTGPILWTGSHLLVWGGRKNNPPNTYVDTGSIYEPIADLWKPITLNGAPTPRGEHAMVWTGSELIVWGGIAGFNLFLGNGGRYDPGTDTWSPISMAAAPTARRLPTVVWTGSQMILWGGEDASVHDAAGGARYRPATDQWYPMSTTGAPASRHGASVIWTGQEMLVWGGNSFAAPYLHNDGGLYDPANDQWRTISIGGAPEPRFRHSTVWTGSALLVWGGLSNTNKYLQSGALYDPAQDRWRPMSLTGAPTGRYLNSAVWTGRQLIIWGGRQELLLTSTFFASGGAYNPATDTWQATSLFGAPSPRSEHTAVWTGREMIIFGGGLLSAFNDGGRLGIPFEVDTDSDGFTSCTGDCDETRATVHPGATQICGDGLNNDCSTIFWPSLEGTNEIDDDGDLVTECGGDCDDRIAATRPGAIELCDAIDNDCNGVTDDGFDQDHDSFTTCAGDCDDGQASVFPAAPQICDGLNNDCGHPFWPATTLTNELDTDGDGLSGCDGDCDDAASTIHAGAVEINDGADNQCPGDEGFGSIDEIAGNASFLDGPGPPAFCWGAQPGADGYLVTRAGNPQFSDGCHRFYTTSTCHEDTDIPDAGEAYYYLVRADGPVTGSWGRNSEGLERAGVCPQTTLTFGLIDTPADDLAPTALRDFFAGVGPAPSDYIFFQILRNGIGGGAWCSPRADFYRNSYLSMAETGGTVSSGSWLKWARVDPSFPWSLEEAGYENSYGSDCHGAWSWCSEWVFPPRLTVQPAQENTCEAYVENLGCGNATWQLTIRIAPSRLAACGF